MFLKFIFSLFFLVIVITCYSFFTIQVSRLITNKFFSLKDHSEITVIGSCLLYLTVIVFLVYIFRRFAFSKYNILSKYLDFDWVLVNSSLLILGPIIAIYNILVKERRIADLVRLLIKHEIIH
jgi:hypothetical protein